MDKIIYNLKECAKLFIIAFIFVMVIMIFVRPGVVKGASMEPNYYHGDRFFIVRNWLIKEYKYGDVVCVDAGDEIYIKRVIGLPGDRIEFKDGAVYRNGELLDESEYLPSETQTESYTKEYEVPEGQYFVMGDNRGVSKDSRSIGTTDKITGRTWFFFRKVWFS